MPEMDKTVAEVGREILDRSLAFQQENNKPPQVDLLINSVQRDAIIGILEALRFTQAAEELKQLPIVDDYILRED